MPGQKMPASWWRDYRRKNRERVNLQQRQRKAVRAAEEGYRERIRLYNRLHHWWKSSAVAVDRTPIPPLFTGHHILEHAWSLVRWRWDNARSIYRDEPYDAAGEAVLAMLEGREPRKAIRRFFAQARERAKLEVPLTEET